VYHIYFISTLIEGLGGANVYILWNVATRYI